VGTGPNWLRLLEPAVRPDGVTAPIDRVSGPHHRPVEQRSFEELLAGARAQAAEETAGASASEPSASPEAPSTAPAATSPLGDLARVDRIENASLRDLFRDGV